jgi:hypothetical protein
MYILCPVVDLIIETFSTYVDVLLYFHIVRSSFLFPSVFQSMNFPVFCVPSFPVYDTRPVRKVSDFIFSQKNQVGKSDHSGGRDLHAHA